MDWPPLNRLWSKPSRRSWDKMWLKVVAIAGALAIAQTPGLAIADEPAPSNCEFHLVNGLWSGTCIPLFGPNTMAIVPARSITTGPWRKGVAPTAVWAGEMSELPDDINEPIELKIYISGPGVLRTPYGWFPVSAFARATSTLRFHVDSQEVAPSSIDRQIVQRAAAILSSAAVWNRMDNRKCPAAATTWSIYCAMEKATIEVTGAFDHRRPALEVVRQIVRERTVRWDYHHALMGYNRSLHSS